MGDISATLLLLFQNSMTQAAYRREGLFLLTLPEGQSVTVVKACQQVIGARSSEIPFSATHRK